MPRYRAHDFLAGAQREASVYLSCYLVAVPIHLETVDQYAHNGAFGDVTFRQPWLFEDVVDDITFNCDVSDDLEVLDDPCKKAQILLVERFNSDEDVVFIPSSNPNSPIISAQECEQLQQRTVDEEDSDDVEFINISHAITPKDPVAAYLLELPELLPDDSDGYRCSIKQLCLHLKKKQVKDPFLSASGMPISQSMFSSKDKKPVFKPEEDKKEDRDESFGGDLPTKEDFIGEKVDEDRLLEFPLCCTPEVTPCRPMTEAVSADTDLAVAPFDDEHNIDEDFGDLKKNTDNSNEIKVGCEKLTIQPKPVVEDESLKWTMKRKPDDTNLKYITEVPAVILIGSTPPPRLPSPFDNPEEVALFDLDLKKNENIISQDTVTKISCQQWNDEKYFGTVSSWLVKEPSTASVTPRKPEDIHRGLMNDLKLTLEPAEDPAKEDISSKEFCAQITGSMESLKSWRRCTEEFLSHRDETDGSVAGNVSQIRIDWGDVSVLTELSLDDICDNNKFNKKQKNLVNIGQETTPVKSISAKIAGMLKQSKTSVGRQPGQEGAARPPDDGDDADGHKEKKQKTETDDLDLKHEAGDTFTSTHRLEAETLTEPLCKHQAGTRPKKAEKRKSAFNDPMNDFLFLSGMSRYQPQPGQFRSRKDGGATKNQGLCQEEKELQLASSNIEKEEHIEETPTPPPLGAKEPDVLPEPLEPTSQKKPERSHAKSKSKTKVVSVKIPEYFKSVLDVIEESSGPLLKQLQEEGAISTTYAYSTLRPNMVGVLLQQEFECTKRRLKQDSDRVLLLIQLYICLSTRETALHSDLSSALQGLGVMIHKYSSIVQGSLDCLRQRLRQLDEKLKENSLEHPKITEMNRQIAFWLTRKILKAGDDQDLKVLVILKKESPSLAENIISSLNTIQGLKAVSLNSSLPASPNTTSRVLDSHNCLLVVASQLDRDFLWAQFSLVVEYECSADKPSVWQSLCIRQNIRHLGFTVECDREERVSSKEETAKSQTPEKSLKLLCSSKITEDSHLLHLLESKYDVVVLERNYNNIRVCYADVIVDIITGVILMTAQEVISTGIEGLTRRINSLSQRFQKIWLIVRDDSEEKSDFQHKTFRKCICQLYSAVAQYSKKEHQYEVKVLFGSSLQEVAELIKHVCRNAEENISSVWHKEDWLNRQCITVQPSKHEAFLMQFPSINSFTAQVLLTFAPLKKLLSSSAEDLATLAPWVPLQFLKIFEKYTHCSFDVDSLMGDPIQKRTMDVPSCTSLVGDTWGGELDHTNVGQRSDPVLASPGSDVSPVSPASAAGMGNLPRIAAAKPIPATQDQQRHIATSVPGGLDHYNSRKESVPSSRDSWFVPAGTTSVDPMRDWQMGTGPPNIISGDIGQQPSRYPSDESMDVVGPHSDSFQSAQSSVLAKDVLETRALHGGDALPCRDSSSVDPRGDELHRSMTARLDPRVTARNFLQRDIHRSSEAPGPLYDRTALELLDRSQYGTSIRDMDRGSPPITQSTYHTDGRSMQYPSGRFAGNSDSGRNESVVLEGSRQTGHERSYDTGGYGTGAGEGGRGIPPMRQLPSYPQQRGGVDFVPSYTDRSVDGSGLRRVEPVAGCVEPEVGRQSGSGVSYDPFQRIKEDCLRQMRTGASRRGNLPPPLVTRDREGQQKSVVRPFHQAPQHAGQVGRQGLRNVGPGFDRLFDETGGKLRIQPAPPIRGKMQAPIEGTGMYPVQQPSGFFEPTASGKHRRLAYQRDPMSSDGQTKLTFL